MAVLRSAFQCAFEQNRQQICIMCPLHQLHRLCQELNGRYNTHIIHRDIFMPVPSCQGPL